MVKFLKAKIVGKFFDGTIFLLHDIPILPLSAAKESSDSLKTLRNKKNSTNFFLLLFFQMNVTELVNDSCWLQEKLRLFEKSFNETKRQFHLKIVFRNDFRNTR